MANIYCQKCGNKTSYQFTAPNFCSKCGNQYLGSSKFSPPSALKTRLAIKRSSASDSDPDDYEDPDEFDEEYDDSDFSNSNSIPRISKIQVEIDASTDCKIMKFEDLVNSEYQSNFKPQKRKNLTDLIDG